MTTNDIIDKYASEPRKGHWVTEWEDGWERRLIKCECSECGGKALKEFGYSMDGGSYKFVRSDFCPNCGADMREEE